MFKSSVQCSSAKRLLLAAGCRSLSKTSFESTNILYLVRQITSTLFLHSSNLPSVIHSSTSPTRLFLCFSPRCRARHYSSAAVGAGQGAGPGRGAGGRLGITTPSFLQASSFLDRVAVIDRFGGHRYGDILARANSLADRILASLGGVDGGGAGDVTGGAVSGGAGGGECGGMEGGVKDGKKGELALDGRDARVCIACGGDVSYVVALWAVWISGCVAVPLSNTHPTSQLRYFMEDSQASLVLADTDCPQALTQAANESAVLLLSLQQADYLNVMQPGENGPAHSAAQTEAYARRWNRLRQLRDANKYARRAALIIYTSGTTGRPKGALHTHGSLHAQVSGMLHAWGWSASDVMLHCLPLYHVHGIVNALLTPLQVGACCVMLAKFDATQVWDRLLKPLEYRLVGEAQAPVAPPGAPPTVPGEPSKPPSLPRGVSVFTAVPTIYSKLLAAHAARLGDSVSARDYVRATCRARLRLFMSGSAPLPVPVLERWEEVTGHRLLERYGMTEIGMALTNPLLGERRPGAVGGPFPHVEVRIARPLGRGEAPRGGGEGGEEFEVVVMGDARVSEGRENVDGELQVRGATLFREYWNRAAATRESFTRDGWFRTGDSAVWTGGAYRLLGRSSVDVIKSGGYKIGALDVERELLAHPGVEEAAVVGVADLTWGQVVAAVVVLRSGAALSAPDLKAFAAERLPPYQVPSVIRFAPEIPRNAMGKVNKKELATEFFGTPSGVSKPKT